MESSSDHPRIVRIGEPVRTDGTLLVDGKRHDTTLTAVRRGDLQIPSPYRAVLRLPTTTRTPISACVAVDAEHLAPLALLERAGSAIGMIVADQSPASAKVVKALKRPRMRSKEDMLALVRVMPSSDDLTGAATARMHVPSEAEMVTEMVARAWGISRNGFHTVGPDGQRVYIAIDDIVSVDIRWDRREGRPIVDLGRNERVEVAPLGWGLVSDDNGQTRVSLADFIRQRSPVYRRGPNINVVMARNLVPYRRTEDDIQIMRDSVCVRERSLGGVDGTDVEKVELSLTFDDATRQRMYGIPLKRSKRSREAAQTMVMPFDECRSAVTIDEAKLREMFKEGKVEEAGSEANRICRNLAVRTLRKMDTLALRIYTGIVAECHGDRMEWAEDYRRICDLLDESPEGKQGQQIRERIDGFKSVEFRLTLEAVDTMLVRNIPLFQYGGSAEVRQVSRRTIARTIWNIHPVIVAWMNTGGRFAYFDPTALRLGGIETEWEFRSYLVLCDRSAAGWVTKRNDPERAEVIKASSLLDAASVDWRRTYGYMASDGDKKRPRRMSDLDRRIRSMVDTLIDTRLVQFAEPFKVSDDPAETSWRFVLPVEHRDELDTNLSKRIAKAHEDEVRKLEGKKRTGKRPRRSLPGG